MRISGRSIIVFVLALTCLLASTASVGSNTSVRAIQPSAEWTVMVFMNGDNDLESYALTDFLEMAAISYNPQVNVVVQLDRIPGVTGAYGDWKHTLRFKLAQGMTPTEENALSPQESKLPEGKEINMGDPGALSCFVEWAQKKYPAHRYMLVIWDHGDGWRLLHTLRIRRNSKAVRSARIHDFIAANALRVARGAKPLQRDFNFYETLDAPYRSISQDVTNNDDRLYMREVQSALEKSLGSSRLQVVGFDACLMQMVENSFAMRHVADVIVASEELEPGDGWQYNDWLPALMTDPTMDAVALGKKLVASYKATWSPIRQDTTLSAINVSTSQTEALAEAISSLGDALRNNLNVDLTNIKLARAECIPYAPGKNYHGIDLYRFCERLAVHTTVPLLRARAQTVMQMLDSSIIDHYAGDDRLGDFGSRGLAIYFPQTKQLYLSDRFASAYRDDNTKYPVEFVQRHRWDNFLHAYFELVP